LLLASLLSQQHCIATTHIHLQNIPPRPETPTSARLLFFVFWFASVIIRIISCRDAIILTNLLLFVSIHQPAQSRCSPREYLRCVTCPVIYHTLLSTASYHSPHADRQHHVLRSSVVRRVPENTLLVPRRAARQHTYYYTGLTAVNICAARHRRSERHRADDSRKTASLRSSIDSISIVC